MATATTAPPRPRLRPPARPHRGHVRCAVASDAAESPAAPGARVSADCVVVGCGVSGVGSSAWRALFSDDRIGAIVPILSDDRTGVDDGFPEITFNFEGGLSLNVYPHDYLFQNGNNLYCVGFQTGGLQSKDGKDMVLLGGSSSIKIKDDKTGSIYTVDAQNISSGWRFQWHKSLISLLVTTVCSYLMF